MNSRNEYKTKVLIKSFMIFFILLLLSLPLILNGIFSGNLSSAWIGFWGSFAGGILGTLGVIYIAKIQSEEQRELNTEQIQSQIDSMHKVEEYNKERLRIEMQVKMLEEYIGKLNDMFEDVQSIRILIIELMGLKRIFDTYDKNDTASKDPTLLQEKEHILNEYKDVKGRFNEFRYDYFKTFFNDLYYFNTILYNNNILLEVPETEAPAELDEMINLITSRINDFDVEKLETDFIENSKLKNDTQKRKKSFPAIENTWRWLRDEQANAYQSIGTLIKKLDR